MKQIHKNIILSAGLLFASAGLMAQTDVEKTDTLAQKVNVAFRTVDRADLMGGVSSVNVEELTNKSYSLYSLDNMQSLVGGYNGQLWNMGEALVLVDGVPREANNIRPTEIAQITFLKAAQAVVLYGSNTLLSAPLYRFWVDETLLLFFWTFDFILYFVISVLDPQKVNRISAQKKGKLSGDTEFGDLQQFLADYKNIETALFTLMDKLISSSPFIPGSTGKKPKTVYTLETLRNYSRISFQLWRKLEQLRQYYNLTIHDPNLTVTKEMCDLAKEVLTDLETKVENSK